MRKLVLAFAAALLAASVSAAGAADLAVKAINAQLKGGYPATRCGFYYGIGTGGSAGAVNGSVVGTQIVQGELDAIVGYTCPFGEKAFWFAEGSVGYNNLNGNVNGLAMSGPLVLMQRGGIGSPIDSMLTSIIPAGTFPSLPAMPSLPAGVTAGNPSGYVFAGVVEQDVGVQIGLDSNSHQWLVAPMVGLGMLTRLSNNVVVDTWAGWQMNSQSFCPGGGVSCAKLGNTGRVGVSLKY